MKELTKIKYWIFDLDNTLYSGQTKVFSEVDKKMSSFISEKFNVDLIEAKNYLTSSDSETIKRLEREIELFSKRLEFEKAANARDQIKFLKEKIYGANIQDKIK